MNQGGVRPTWCFVALAALVVVAAAGRWLPREPRRPLALGDALRDWRFDRELSKLRPAVRRGRLLPRLGYQEQTWVRLLQAARKIESESGDDVTVQLRGAPRDQWWTLSYLLYPRHLTGSVYEDGGRPDDQVEREADWLVTFGPKFAVRRRRG